MITDEDSTAAFVARALLMPQCCDDLLLNAKLVQKEYGFSKDQIDQLVKGFKAIRDEGASPETLAEVIGAKKWKLS
jgi:hypothetical protein